MQQDLFSLKGKVALVTGTSRGLGAGMARALAAFGADLAVHDREAPCATEEHLKAMGSRTGCFAADLSNRAAADRLVADVIDTMGRIDILVNNAGIIRRHPAETHSDEDWDTVIELNLTNVFRLSRAVGKHMIERGQGGKIVNIASLLAFQGGIFVPGYTAAKGGVAQLTKAFATEWAPHRINVNAIAPGYMATDNTAPLRADQTRSRQILERIPAARWGDPDDLAGPVVFLASAASDYVTGHVLVVDGGWLAR